jgi:polyhydroxyalkanoate synthase
MKKVDALHGNDGVNVVGYCIGGTTLSLTQAWLQKTKQENPAKSCTFFTALTDFEDPGPLKSFIDEGFISGIMIEAQRKGYLDQRIMARTFSFLRPNDLVYGPAVKAYLLGEQRPKFDLLFWNEDSTRLPERMAREYLTHLYRDNQFATGRLRDRRQVPSRSMTSRSRTMWSPARRTTSRRGTPRSRASRASRAAAASCWRNPATSPAS